MMPNPLAAFQARVPRWWAQISGATKGWLLLVLSLPALLSTIISLAKGALPAILVNGLAFSLYLLAFVLLRRDVLGQQRQQGKLVLHPSSPPYRWMASFIVALTTMAMSRLGVGHPLPVAALFGAGAWFGMYLSYGVEMLTSVRRAVPDVAGVDRAASLRILEEAEQQILAIERAGQKIRNPELLARLGRITALAKNILADLIEDPRQIRRSRKFLSVYLDGVEKVVSGYSQTHAQVHSELLEGNFRSVLAAIEDGFQEQRQRLLDKDIFDLDVQMEVLAAQLKREGIS